MPSITCLSCDKNFHIPPSREGVRKHCSQACYAKTQERKVYNQHLKKRVKKNCLHCDKEFEVREYRKKSARFCSKSCSSSSRTGEDSNAWKGDDVGYHGVHDFIRRTYGKASKCTECGDKNATGYEWSNISGEYKRDRDDWRELCIRCHRIIDQNAKKSWETRKASVS